MKKRECKKVLLAWVLEQQKQTPAAGRESARALIAALATARTRMPSTQSDASKRRSVAPHERVRLIPFSENRALDVVFRPTQATLRRPPVDHMLLEQVRHLVHQQGQRAATPRLSTEVRGAPPGGGMHTHSPRVAALLPGGSLPHMPARPMVDGLVITDGHSGMVTRTLPLRIVVEQPQALSARARVLPMLRRQELDKRWELEARLRHEKQQSLRWRQRQHVQLSPQQKRAGLSAEVAFASSAVEGEGGEPDAARRLTSLNSSAALPTSAPLARTASPVEEVVASPVIDRRDARLQDELHKLFDTDHDQPAEGIAASALSMAAARTWAVAKQQLDALVKRSRRGSNQAPGNEIQYAPVDATTPTPAVEPQVALTMLGKVPWCAAI